MSTLFLIPTTLSNQINHHALLPHELALIKHLQYFIVETAKTGRLHLKQLNLATKLQELNIQELNKHNNAIESLITPLKNGLDLGLISDCGLPAIADPGHQVVALAHQYGFKVKPLVGPSSLMLALMSSGVNGQSFAFNGYLPIDNNERLTKLKQLEKLIIDCAQSQIIIETPFRNQQLLEFLIKHLKANLTLTIAVDLMSEQEQIFSKSIQEWQQLSLPIIQKKEAVFILGRASLSRSAK